MFDVIAATSLSTVEKNISGISFDWGKSLLVRKIMGSFNYLFGGLLMVRWVVVRVV